MSVLSGVTGGWGGAQGEECPQPRRVLTGKFVLNYRGKRGKDKKGKGVKFEKENCKREGGKLKMEG